MMSKFAILVKHCKFYTDIWIACKASRIFHSISITFCLSQPISNLGSTGHDYSLRLSPPAVADCYSKMLLTRCAMLNVTLNFTSNSLLYMMFRNFCVLVFNKSCVNHFCFLIHSVYWERASIAANTSHRRQKFWIYSIYTDQCLDFR